MDFRQWLQAIENELRELKRAWRSAAIVVGLAVIGTWYLAGLFYAERVATLGEQVNLKQQRIEALEHQAKPAPAASRHLTAEQRNTIMTMLQAVPKPQQIELTSRAGSDEAMEFTYEIEAVFRALGWDTRAGQYLDAEVYKGLIVEGPRMGDPVGDQITEAFRAAGLVIEKRELVLGDYDFNRMRSFIVGRMPD